MVRISLTISSDLKSWRRLFLLWILLFLFYSLPLNAQWDMDTLQVSFPVNWDRPLKSDLPIRVYDSRDEAPNVIGMYERNKFYLIPVDLRIELSRPLSENIQDHFPKPVSEKDITYVLVIRDFQVTVKSSSLLYPRYQLNAALKGYQKIQEDSTYIGEWVYEATSRKPIFGGGLKKGFESVLQKWQEEFLMDWGSDPQTKIQKQPFPLTRFRPWDYSDKSLHMLSGFGVCIGSDFYTSDITIYFSERTGRNPTFRSGGYNLRYRSERDFDAIEFGLSIDRWIFRKHRFWIFQIKSNLLFGLNRWKDISKREHELYDAVLFDAAVSQSFIYQPMDQQSVIFGIGLSQSVNYIYSKKVRFQIGAMIHLGIQL